MIQAFGEQWAAAGQLDTHWAAADQPDAEEHTLLCIRI